MASPSKQGFKTCSAKVLVVGERLRKLEPAHDEERYLVNDARRCRETRPSWLVLVVPRCNIPLAGLEPLIQHVIDGRRRLRLRRRGNNPRLELDEAMLWYCHLPRRPKDAVFENCLYRHVDVLASSSPDQLVAF
jgi:hypothetical protein